MTIHGQRKKGRPKKPIVIMLIVGVFVAAMAFLHPNSWLDFVFYYGLTLFIVLKKRRRLRPSSSVLMATRDRSEFCDHAISSLAFSNNDEEEPQKTCLDKYTGISDIDCSDSIPSVTGCPMIDIAGVAIDPNDCPL